MKALNQSEFLSKLSDNELEALMNEINMIHCTAKEIYKGEKMSITMSRMAFAYLSYVDCDLEAELELRKSLKQP